MAYKSNERFNEFDKAMSNKILGSDPAPELNTHGKILVGEVYYSPTNPRKFFDPVALQELADSIKQVELISPIVVRPRPGGGYELVAGERRHRAHVLNGMEWIRADVRELTDEQVLDIQITENLQRVNPHPIEEANVFKSLIDGGMSEDMVAAKYGKKVHFIRQRVRLTDMVPEWQDLFFRNLISLQDAIDIASMIAEHQQKLLSGKAGKEPAKHTDFIKFSLWDFKNQKPLSSAPFDLQDPKLVKKAGACSSCKYNTAFAALFPEDVATPMCNNMDCYATKVAKNLDKMVIAALKEEEAEAGSWLFVNFQTMLNDTIDEIRSKGHKVLSENTHFRKLNITPIVTEAELRKQKVHESNIESMVIKSEMQNKKDLANLEKMKKTGVAKRALVVGGSDKQMGTVIYVTIVATETPKQAADKGVATVEQLEQEKIRIKMLEITNEEKDRKVIYTRMSAVMKDSGFKEIFRWFDAVEMVAVITSVLDNNSIEWKVKDYIDGRLAIDRGKHSGVSLRIARVDQLLQLPEDQLQDIMCYALRNQVLYYLTGDNYSREHGKLLELLADTHDPVNKGIVLTEQADITVKRKANVKKKLDKIDEQLAEKNKKAGGKTDLDKLIDKIKAAEK